ncbi:MAG: hypothetical protein JW759_06335 [Candidatus Coatesbacteria bacterium]|nr:hypothetical protein [Candidatus Coatesbacteria bacterium]
MPGYLSALVRLWAVSFGLGLVALPVVLFPCKPLRDRGYAVSKVLGVLFVTYGAWLASTFKIAPFGLGSILTAAAILAGASTATLLARRKETMELIAPRLRSMALSEVVFTASLALILLLIGFYPDIAPRSEGMMDIGILNSVSRTEFFPAKDVWMSGEAMNYYYFGHVLAATLAKLCAMTPLAFYNPAKALVFSLFWLSVFALGFSMTGRALYGLLALFLVGIAGNFDALLQLLASHSPLRLDWFGASRVIPGTINEFPFFSLLWGDLHAYVLSFPLFATSLSLLFCLNARLAPSHVTSTSVKPPYGLMALLALCGGALTVTNTWDFLSMSIVLFVIVVSMLPLLNTGFAGRIIALVSVAAPIVAGAVVLFLPFLASVSQNRPMGFVKTRTDLADFLVVFGVLLVPIMLELVVVIDRTRAGAKDPRPRPSWTVPTFAIICVFVAVGRPTWILLLAIIPLAVLEHLYSGCSPPARGGANLSNGQLSRRRFFTILIISGALIAFSCEMFFIEDVYGGHLARMNTVFKLYLHVWVLWGLAGAYAVWAIRRRLLQRLGPLARRMCSVLVVFCLGSGALYPLLAPITRTGLFVRPYTLDVERQFEARYPRDAAAAKWLRENIPGQVVIAEASASAYDWPGRISAFTGHCAVVGWRGHEAGWRDEFTGPYRRSREMSRFYESTDLEVAKDIISEYGIQLVYFGEVERELYGDEGFEKFERAFETIYASDKVRVFDVSKPKLPFGESG